MQEKEFDIIKYLENKYGFNFYVFLNQNIMGLISILEIELYFAKNLNKDEELVRRLEELIKLYPEIIEVARLNPVSIIDEFNPSSVYLLSTNMINK